MAGLLATYVVAVLAHVIDDVAITHRGAHERQAQILQVVLEPRFDMTVATTPPAASLPRRCQLSAMTAMI